VRSPSEFARPAGRRQEAEPTPAAVRPREIALGRHAIWLWLATLVVLAIALVTDHLAERDQPLSVAAQSLFHRLGG
jgi:hypothetical protein